VVQINNLITTISDSGNGNGGNSNDAFEGTWVSNDNFIRLEASNGSFNQYLVSNGKEVVRGNYTVSGNTVSVTMTQINTALFEGADQWVTWANLSDTYKEDVGGSATQQIFISGNAFTINGKTLTKQSGTGGGGLSAPTGLRVTDSNKSSITIAWNSVSGADSYKVYRGDAMRGIPLIVNPPEYIDSCSGTSFTDWTVYEYEDYYYQVSAVFPGGTESQMSAYIPGTSMSKLTGLRVTGSTANSISLSWNPVEGAECYYVYRSASLNGEYEDIIPGFNDPTGTSYTNNSLQPNRTYYYKVAGVPSNGGITRGPLSDPVQGMTTSF
jgi:hypothetical protein